MIATGGGDDQAFIWSLSEKKIIFELKKDNETIDSIGFNFDGQLLATGSLSGNVRVFSTKTGELLYQFEGPADEIRVYLEI